MAIRWGIAPIGWRNDDLPALGATNTFQHVLSDIAVAGFEGTEVGGFFPAADIVNFECALRDLEVVGQWFSSYIVRDGIETVIPLFHEHCLYLQNVNASIAVVSEQTYGIQTQAVSIFGDVPQLNDAEWLSFTQGLNTLGAIAQSYGLTLAYHHHLGTVVQTKVQIDQLLQMTDEGVVSLLYDTGHLFAAGEDTLSILQENLPRIAHIHFKDVRSEVLSQSKQQQTSFIESFLAGLFTVPGDGVIDFKKIFDEIQRTNYKGWIIVEAEQDPRVAHPLQYAKMARRYIDETLLVNAISI